MPQKLKYNTVPDDVIKATEKRFRDFQRKFGSPLEKTRSELIAQNKRSKIQDRLEQEGVAPKLAKEASRAASANRSLDQESMSGATISDKKAFERILDSNDLVDVRFLLNGAALSASVGRINFGGRGFATGFLVGPGVIMTNHHVFERAADTHGAQIEFGFREIEHGGSLSTPTKFRFDTGELFFADEDLDVAIVAIGSRTSGNISLDELPVLSLVPDPDFVLAGDRLNIVQHPAGEPKQVALRDNTVLAVPDESFIHYRSDTKRGSSGSPVLNDEWQLVGLHHSGVPLKDDHGNWLDIFGNVATVNTPNHQIAWIANEGIQSSALVKLFHDTNFRGSERRLVDGVLEQSELAESFDGSAHRIFSGKSNRDPEERNDSNSEDNTPRFEQDHTTIRVNVPLEISVKVGAPLNVAIADSDSDAPVSVDRLHERFGIDRDYSNRNGYDDGFLDRTLEMPALTEDQMARAAVNREPIDGDLPYVLRFHNFSVVMNGQRRLAYF
ncbi:MAG: serine protease, partial [Planctomycetota bacterium]